VADSPAGEDAAAGHDAVDGLPAAVLLVEGELGGRVGNAGGADGPLAVIEVELGANGPEIHVGLVACLDGPYVAPVRGCIDGCARDTVGLVIVGIDLRLAGEFGQNVA